MPSALSFPEVSHPALLLPHPSQLHMDGDLGPTPETTLQHQCYTSRVTTVAGRATLHNACGPPCWSPPWTQNCFHLIGHPPTPKTNLCLHTGCLQFPQELLGSAQCWWKDSGLSTLLILVTVSSALLGNRRVEPGPPYSLPTPPPHTLSTEFRM